MTKRMIIRSVSTLIVLGVLLPCATSNPVIRHIAPAPAGIAPSVLADAQIATLLLDDFEAGSDRWVLESGTWSIVDDGGNHVLDGTGHAWATLDGGREWTDYVFTARVRRVTGSIHLMFRMSEDRGRYIVGLHAGGMYLHKEAPWGKFTELATDNTTPFTAGTWHTIKIEVDLNRIQVSVDDSPCIDYTDPITANKWPLWQGNVGLEATAPVISAHAQFDDVEVVGLLNTGEMWVRTGGPMGGLGYDVRYASPDKQAMFVTDNYAGVFKSTDGGQVWFPTNRGITGRFWPSGDAIPVFTLNMDPNSYDNVWAGLKDVKGAYKSTDGGRTWVEVTPVITEPQFVFRGFEVVPGDSNRVFAAGELPMNVIGKEFDIVKGRVYYTEDGGASWQKIWEGDNLARYVITHPENHDVIYVSTGIFDREANNSDCTILSDPIRGGVGVLKGEKAGSSWNWTVFSTTHGLSDLYVGSLVMHPENPDILLAGAGNNSCSTNPDRSLTGGVFRTTDGGLTWTHTLTNEIITSVEFAPSNPQIAYAGGRSRFYASQDGGQNWTLVAGADFPWGPPGIVAGFPIDILVDPDDPAKVFCNNYGGGNVVSADGGCTWSLASDGYTGALMFDVEVHPTDRGQVYASARSGAFRAADGGASWEGLAYSPASLVETYAIALKPDDPRVVLTSGELDGYLYRSEDGGFSWSRVYELSVPSGERHGFKRIVFAPSNPSVVYAGSCTARTPLHLGNTQSFGVYRSANAGLDWDPANDSSTGDKCINNLAVHPADEAVVYAATASGGLYKTVDGGSSWLTTTLPITDVRSVAIHPMNPNIVYAGTQDSGVYRSTDGGASWVHLVAGMEPNDAIWALVFDPVDPNVVYAGSFISGVYRWNADEGLWTHINSGLRTRAVVDLAISHDGSVLYAATWGEGVFRLGDHRRYTYLSLVLLDFP
jgi:photosystem II stability/assembly factor-like uncharacterized protein